MRVNVKYMRIHSDSSPEKANDVYVKVKGFPAKTTYRQAREPCILATGIYR